MRRAGCFLLGFVIATSCHPKAVPVDVPVVKRGSYAYACFEDGKCWVVTISGQYLPHALKAIGCGKQAVCMHGAPMQLYLVEQVPQ